jgi:glutamate synthase domain-containing protein 2
LQHYRKKLKLEKILMKTWGSLTHGHFARRLFFALAAASVLTVEGLVREGAWDGARELYWLFVPIILIGLNDLFQTKHAIRRNFPVVGNFRYFLESIRPEINQYFVESNIDGRPFSRERRSVIYQRAKGVEDTVPFGTQSDVYAVDYEWVNHSIAPKHAPKEIPRVLIGGPDCKQPYSAALLNISAMSYGSLSSNAVLALSKGAKKGGFYHNTGEGGLTPHHLEGGGDLVWQLGTAYFGARGADGAFNPEKFQARVKAHPQVKMIEIKLSQGAKPGHGGILPAAKVTREISEIRDVPMGQDVISPPWHTAFDSPIGLMIFIKQLRDLSGGLPIGFKLCLGKRREFMALCKAMIESGITPDFITVDGGEGGTGAAPLEFSNSIGTPLNEGLVFVHNALTGAGVRDRIKIICSGKVTTGVHMFQKFALGADLCNSARGMLFSLGCIQALRCNTNTCPTGVATQDKALVKGLVVADKFERVARYHHATVKSFLDVLGATGLTEPKEIKPWHVQKRISAVEVKHYGEIYDFLKKDSLLQEPRPKGYDRPWRSAQATSWDSLEHE